MSIESRLKTRLRKRPISKTGHKMPLPPPPPAPESKFGRLKRKFKEYKEGQREKELTKARSDIERDRILVRRDRLRAQRAEATRRMVRAGGGSFKERMQYGTDDILGNLGGFGAPQQRQAPRKRKRKQQRSKRKQPQRRREDPYSKLMWG